MGGGCGGCMEGVVGVVCGGGCVVTQGRRPGVSTHTPQLLIRVYLEPTLVTR